MAIERRNEGFYPVTSNPDLIMSRAKGEGKVIECRGGSGVTHSFLHYEETQSIDFWIARCELSSGQFRTWIVDANGEETVENCIARCDPDVRLTSEELSTFGGDSDS